MKILITEKSSGKEVMVDSIVQAAEFTGVDRRKIKKALTDPFNWIHQSGPRKLKDGSYSMKRAGCAFDFNLIGEENVIELWPVDDFHSSEKFTSIHKACKFLGISKASLYRLRKTATVGEALSKPVMDKEGYEWLVVFLKDIDKVPDNFKHHD